MMKMNFLLFISFNFKACPIGQYSYSQSSSCSPCPGGHYCTNGTSPVVPPVPCPFGFYSPIGSGECQSCPACKQT